MQKIQQTIPKIGTINKNKEYVIDELNKHNITFFSFTFANYESMGPLATSFFIKSNNVPAINDPKILSKLPKPALIAYHKAYNNTQMKTLFKSSNIG